MRSLTSCSIGAPSTCCIVGYVIATGADGATIPTGNNGFVLLLSCERRTGGCCDDAADGDSGNAGGVTDANGFSGAGGGGTSPRAAALSAALAFFPATMR